MACDAASAAKERRHDAVITTVVSAHAAPRTTDALGPNAPDASAMAASDGTREYVNTGKSARTRPSWTCPAAPAVRRRQPLHEERLRRLEIMEEDERDEQPELAPGRGMRQRGEGGSPASSHRTSPLAVVVVVTRASGARGVVLLVCRRRGSHASSPPARPAPRAVRGEEGSAT